MPFVGKLAEEHLRFFEKNNIYASLKAIPPTKLRKLLIGRAVSVADYVTVEPYCSFVAPGRSFYSLGAHSYCRSAFKEITIGRFCSIATGAAVMPPNHPMERLSTSGLDYANYPIYRQYLADKGASMKRTPTSGRKPAPRVGHDVWIGMDAVIGRGVTIGHGAVIGARSIVTKDVEPYSIVVGSPAKHIRYRFDETLRTRLLALAWWDHDPADYADLDTTDPERFIDQFEERRAAGRIAEYRPRQIRLAEELARISAA